MRSDRLSNFPGRLSELIFIEISIPEVMLEILSFFIWLNHLVECAGDISIILALKKLPSLMFLFL